MTVRDCTDNAERDVEYVPRPKSAASPSNFPQNRRKTEAHPVLSCESRAMKRYLIFAAIGPFIGGFLLLFATT